MTLYTIPISDSLYTRLLHQSQDTNRPIIEIVQQTLDRFLPEPIQLEGELEPLLQAELEAMVRLSDSALWALASSNLTPTERDELEMLNVQAKERSLTVEEQDCQEKLLTAYDEMLVRRARAAVLLQSRGYDISDPSLFS